MLDALLICITAFATGFAAAWALGTRTREQLAALMARADEPPGAAADDQARPKYSTSRTIANVSRAQ